MHPRDDIPDTSAIRRDDRAPLSRLAYSPVEVAAVVGLSRSKIMQLIANGTIPSYKVDRARRVLHSDLVAWLDGLKNAL